jgi:fructose-1-phosphate kinase PfkB-like protein
MPPSVKPVDDVGAGDSFDAGFIHKFTAGARLEDCLASQTGLVRTQQPKKAVRRRFAIALHLPVLCANLGKLSAGTCPR